VGGRRRSSRRIRRTKKRKKRDLLKRLRLESETFIRDEVLVLESPGAPE